MSESSRGQALDPESASLIGLGAVHRDGLIGVTVVAGLSFVMSTALFLHLTIKLLQWHVRQRRRRTEPDPQLAPKASNVDLSLGLAPKHFQRRAAGPLGVVKAEDSRDESGARPGSASRSSHTGQQQGEGVFAPAPAEQAPAAEEPNQFVVLLYNLLLADIHQSMAFVLNLVWVVKDKIDINTPTCWAQGWFVSTGDLAASLFITAIAVHTYMVGVQGRKPSQRAIIVTCVAIWAFDYLMVPIGMAVTRNGASGGGFYVRATAWCWINKQYDDLRLLTHYLFIFMSLLATSVIYTLIFLHLTKRGLDSDSATAAAEDGAASDVVSKNAGRGGSKRPWSSENLRGGYSWGFLTYPVIYIILTSPLAIGRIMTMANVEVSIAYFCASGALISANGLLDVLIWGFTRRDVVFGDVAEVAGALGLETFSFMRTPQDRKYGNMVWVEGAGSARSNAAANGTRRAAQADNDQSVARQDGVRIWSWWKGLRSSGWLARRRLEARGGEASAGADGYNGRAWRGGGRTHGAQRSVSQESLRGFAGRPSNGEAALGGIQMDLVTTVVIETDPESSGNGLVVSPSDYIAAMGPLVVDDELAQGSAATPTWTSSRSGEKGVTMNMDILNKP